MLWRRSAFFLVVVNQDWAWGPVQDFGRLIQTKQPAKKARMMACGDDQVGIEFTGHQRDFLSWFASGEFFCARWVGLLERLGQISQCLFHQLPVVVQHSE
jgi:hypothetical protein